MHRKERGATIVEAAFTLSTLFLLFLGMLGFGVVFGNYQLMTDAAREGARYAVIAVNTPTSAQVATRVCSYLVSGTRPANCTTPHAVATCTIAGGTFPPPKAVDGVYVTVCPPIKQPNNLSIRYTEVSILRNVKLPLLPNIALHTTAAMRNETN
jgi:Flp pilus assembly protein TadG